MNAVRSLELNAQRYRKLKALLTQPHDPVGLVMISLVLAHDFDGAVDALPDQRIEEEATDHLDDSLYM